MNLWSNMESSNVDIDILAQVIREAGHPVHVNNLARSFVQARMLAERKHVPRSSIPIIGRCEAGVKTREVRRYTPSATYAVGEKVRWKGKFGEVKAVADGENPRQGNFVVLTLVFPDGSQIRLAAKAGGEEIQDRRSVSDEKVLAIVREYGLAIRTAIQDAMRKDARFVWFEDAQGDNWCLTGMLPEVENEDLAKVFPLLQGLLKDGVFSPRPTEELVKTIWGQSSDGSDEYALKAFALNVALQRCNDTHWIGNGGWVLESEWQKLQEREALIGPRQPSKIELPEGVTLDTSGESEAVAGEVEEEEEPEEQETPIPEDLEAWRRNRRLNATITLRASHYHGYWLPLTKDMRRVFPPRASGADSVTFYHHFGDEQESFQAWVDWNQQRILGSPQMYQAFYEHRIYPGAVLVISHRENEQEYDIRTKPPTKDESVRVRRVFFAADEEGNRILDEDGHPKLKYEEDNEPRRYEVADEVFIVGASWENLPELFAEAERVGQGYFGLMYEVCCEWWDANGRKPLYVTADELFQEIHYNRRLVTSEATIPWELWRRLAFKPVGDGQYLFRPEKGDQTHSVGLRKRPSRTQGTQQVKRDSSLGEIAERVRVRAVANYIADGKGVKTVKEDSRDYRESIHKVRTLSIQLGFMDFKNNIINYPRPEWLRTLEDILAIAEHLNVVKEEVNCTGGFSVTELDKLLCKTYNSINYRFVTHSRNFERLLSSPGGDRRQMRLYIQLAHLLGFVTCSSYNAKRSNLMVTDFVEDIINVSHNLDAAKQFLIQKFANFKVWGPFVGRLKSSEHYEEIAYRPVCAIIKYLLEKQCATRFELGALFGFVPKGLYTENDVVAYALDVSMRIFENQNEYAQKIRFCQHHGWTNPTPETVAEEISGSYDPGFIVEELLRIMEVLGIIEQQNELWQATTEIVKNETLQYALQMRPLNVLEFYSNPDTLTILALLPKMIAIKLFLKVTQNY
jgi:hypothetical protein